MFQRIIAASGGLIHLAFIPVVNAEEEKIQHSTEETFWDRLKAIAHTKLVRFGVVSLCYSCFDDQFLFYFQ